MRRYIQKHLQFAPLLSDCLMLPSSVELERFYVTISKRWMECPISSLVGVEKMMICIGGEPFGLCVDVKMILKHVAKNVFSLWATTLICC